MKKPIVLAVAAHPDDVELVMSGTLMRLQAVGADVHIWTLANGSCGTNVLAAPEIVRLRHAEACAAAATIGATYHDPLFDDIAIFYDRPSLAKVAGVLRQIAPDIVLTQSPNEYMEDHCNTCRLVVTAAFCRGMPNFSTDPPTPHYEAPLALYHSAPFSMTDSLGTPVKPHFYIDVSDLMAAKVAMLACHRTQKEWLDVSQGLDAYLVSMRENCRRIGDLCGRCDYAEAWFRHSPLGFCGPEHHPLQNLLKEYYYGTTSQ